MQSFFHILKKVFIQPGKLRKENDLLNLKIKELEEKENQLQILNVNLVNSFWEKERRLIKEWEEKADQERLKTAILEREISRMRCEMANLIQTDRKSQQRIARLQSLVDNQNHQIQDLEDKIKKIPVNFTDSKQVKKLRNNIQEKERELEFMKREMEEKNELIRTLRDQLLFFNKQREEQHPE